VGAAVRGIAGLTVVVAAVVVVVVVAISAGVDCCSWLRVAMLEQCAFAGGNSRSFPL
jgi:cytochrome c-type biogenesis protein CcmH/NrfG